MFRWHGRIMTPSFPSPFFSISRPPQAAQITKYKTYNAAIDAAIDAATDAATDAAIAPCFLSGHAAKAT